MSVSTLAYHQPRFLPLCHQWHHNSLSINQTQKTLIDLHVENIKQLHRSFSSLFLVKRKRVKVLLMTQKQETWPVINRSPQHPCQLLKTAAQTGRDNPRWGWEAETSEPLSLAGSLMKLTELSLQNRQVICTLLPGTKEIQFQGRKEAQGSVERGWLLELGRTVPPTFAVLAWMNRLTFQLSDL